MKRKDVLISLAIIAAAALTVWLCLQGKGYVRLDAGDANAELQVRNGWFAKATITSGAGAEEISTRVLQAQRLSISQRQNGQNWRIESVGPFGKLERIKVKANETTVLKLGPPFLIKPMVHQSGSRVSIEFVIMGQAGEYYQNWVSKNNRRLSTPTVRIVDESEKVLAVGKFEYG